MDDIPQDVLDIIEELCREPREPLIFSPEWWVGGYGEAFLAGRADKSRKFRWTHNGWPEPPQRLPDEEP